MKTALFVLALAGCPDGGTGTTGPAVSPLIGKWGTAVSSGGVSYNEVFDLQDAGTANLTITGTGSCHGTQSYTGGTWTSTANTLTLGGTPACTGQIDCTIMGAMISIGFGGGSNSGTFTYTLGSNNNTLTLTQTNDAGSSNSLTLTRQ